MKLQQINCGFLPLVDCAPLIIAQELEFAAEEGLSLNLIRQPSWSALRDMLALGHLEAAHMLSPMPIAMSLGLGGMPSRIDALMVLSVNGTVIGVSAELASKMSAQGWINRFSNPLSTATAVFSASEGPLRIGVPFPFSMHRMLVEYWLFRHPDFRRDQVEIVTVPPPRMADAVRDGLIDMFCVGEPWGSVAVHTADASLVLPGASIWQFAPEKVLGVRHEWAERHPDVCRALLRAVYKGARWLGQPENHPLAADILARSHHLDLPEHAIDPALTCRIATHRGASPVHSPQFLVFQRNAASFPWRSQAAWIASRIAQWHDLSRGSALSIGMGCFRSDLYRQSLSGMGIDMPGASEKVEGSMRHETAVASTRGHMFLSPDTFYDGAIFDFSSELAIKY